MTEGEENSVWCVRFSWL